ncbi:hypothetical protein B0H63DRAFT_200724 [Podospora didyma]|uniref:Uncharacterized protein n=1 Tax=Podospora didyma TaxID=330526 RepID=A0AAE0NH46_9PEZI|nr:hypothetical protein B0H63DRAFT_200724 [Podospora didyma]
MQHIPPTAMPMLRARRRRGIGPINLNALHPGESTEDVEFVAGNGDRVTLQNALVSPLYPRCFMTPKTAEVLGFIPCGLVDADIQAFPTPRGVFEITRTVALCFRLPLLPSPPLVVEIPILSDDEPDPGVPIILGRSFIEYMDSLSFPNPQYVELDVPFAPPNGGLNVWFEDYNGAVANMPMANGVVDFLPRHDVAPVANMPIADGMVDFPENSGDAMANMPAADVMAWQGWIGYEEYDPWRA